MVNIGRKVWVRSILPVLLVALVTSAWFVRLVVWTPGSLRIEAPADSTRLVKVQLASEVTLRGVQLRVKGPSRDSLSVKPQRLQRLVRAAPREVLLTVRAPASLAVGETLELRVVPSVKVWWFSVPVGDFFRLEIVGTEDDGLPPDPGEENDLTLKGVDSDEDGVRDDVQIAIAARGLSGEKEEALRQMARAIQGTIIVGGAGDPVGVDSALLAIADATSCLNEQFDENYGDAIRELVLVENMLLDTDERVMAELAFRELADGKIVPSGNGCT